MRETRQVIPENLGDIAPGPELARVLAEVDLARLSGYDCVEVLRAQSRQVNHEQARLMAAMVEVACCPAFPQQVLERMAEPDDYSADEIRAALTLTRRAATVRLNVAWDLVVRLPAVHAALQAGVLDYPRAAVFADWTLNLTDDQARALGAALLPQAPRWTTGQLIERIKRHAIALDPDWARRRYEQAVAERRVVGSRNPDGSANLSGHHLPIERVAAASGRIDALAKAAKHAGDRRRIDWIRAELFLGMTDGSYTGLDDTRIIQLLLAQRQDEDPPDDDPGGYPRQDGPDGNGPDDGPDGGGPDDHRPADSDHRGGGDEPATGCGDADSCGSQGNPDGDGSSHGDHAMLEAAAPPAVGRTRVGACVELRVGLSTLLGHNRYPAEVAGWGPVHAELARELAAALGRAEWRYALTDEQGHLSSCGITPARPTGWPGRATGCRALVELQVPAASVRALAEHPAQLGAWLPVVTDLALRLEEHPRGDDAAADGDPQRRIPGAVLRRWVEIRDRCCAGPGCRARARAADQDHTRDHAAGGRTVQDNLGSLCRHDHSLKHEGGWCLAQPEPGVFQWTSRLGHVYQRRPPPILEPLPDPLPSDGPDYPIWVGGHPDLGSTTAPTSRT